MRATTLRRTLLPAVGIGLLVACVLIQISTVTRFFADAYTYLAAAERLNAGSELYALGPGDRWIWIRPPYWTVPLLSPPPIAVAWRPAVALLGETSVYVWAVLTIGATCAVLALLLARTPGPAGLAIGVLSIPIAFELSVGNVNGLLILGAALVWIWRAHDRAAVILGAMVAVKLAPIVLAVVLVRRPRSLGVLAGTLGVLLAASVAGAGVDAHLEYLRIALDVHPSEYSLAGLTGIRWLGTAALLGGSVAAFAAAIVGRTALAYRLAVLTMVFGSPVVNVNTLSMLVLLLVPTAFPEVAAGQPAATTSRGRIAAAPWS